ncbi:unnamed protein product [Rhizoctonia solani]|uniref:Uncharacterized protein n=1 Tax=Rhizoctonia solani TaxID=456999 RepID=A0A8H3E3Y7_9AGAM|nr:unnamed protein product [Rhizoctonia solani]
MRLFAIYISTVFPPLVTALTHMLDAKAPIVTATFPNKLEIHVHGAVETLNIVYPPPVEHNSHPDSLDSITSPRMEWHILGVGIATILLVSATCLLWKHLNGAQGGIGVRSHQPGRSNAVSGTAPEQGGPPQYDSDHAKSPPRRRFSTAVACADDAPHYTSPHRRTTYPPTPLVEEPEELDNVVDQELATLGGNYLRRYATKFRHALRILTYGWLPTNRPEPVVASLSVCPLGSRSLLGSLYKGSRDLGEDNSVLGRFIFFLVGVDIQGKEDAENDVKYLQQMLESPAHGSPPLYKCMYGPNATRARICKAARVLFGKAQAMLVPPRMFLLFTGIGDDNNMMHLPNGERLFDADLKGWLPPSDQATKPILSMIFDICRENPRLAAISESIDMAWSCSVGEYAYAVRFSKQEDKPFPRSIFLLAIFLAAHHTNIHKRDDYFFEAAFALHIKQLGEFIQLMYDKSHQNRCPHCPTDKPCDPPVAQTPDLQHAGRAVTRLGMLIATHFPQHALEVFTEVDRRMQEGGFPRRLCPLSDPTVVQPIKPSPGRDKNNSDPNKVPRAKSRFASVQSGPLPKPH